MERRELLLKCLGGTSIVLPQWPVSPVALDAAAKIDPDVGGLMEEVMEACHAGWARMDCGYPIPYLDRAWRQLPQEAGTSVRAVIVEKREELARVVQEAEDSLASHRVAVERQPFDWEPRYWLAFTLKRAGRIDDALQEYLAVAPMPGCPDCLNEIGWCYYRKGMYEDARRCFETVKNADEDVPVRSFSERLLTLENQMLVYGQLKLRAHAEEAAQEYVRRYGRIGYPERRALARIGIDADEIYLRQHLLRG